MNFTRLGKYLLVPFAVFVSFIPIFDPFNIFSNLRNSAFDLFQNISPRESVSSDSVIVIDIDETSLSKIGQWPWSRNILADLVDKTYLSASLSFDIVFAESDRTGSIELQKQYNQNSLLLEVLKEIPDNDDIFANSISNHSTVVLGAIPSNSITNNFKVKFGLIEQGDDPRKFLQKYTGIQSNIKKLDASAKGIGSMSIGNNDSIIRKLPLFENINGSLVPSLALETLRVAIGASTFQIKSSNASGETAFGEETGINHIKLGNLIIPTNPDGSAWIHFSKKPAKTLPLWEVLSPKYSEDYFEGKILIVGTSAPGLFDLRSTPLENNIPGVNIIANLTDQILSGQFLKRPDWIFGLEVITGLILALLVTFFIQILGPIGGLSVFIIGNSMSSFGSYYFFNSYGFLVDPISPLVICLICYLVVTFFNFLFTELERSKVRNAFSQYMSPLMVEKLAKSSESLKLGGERKEMTFLFSDIRGFTSISEKYKNDPEALTDLINSLLTSLSNEILNYQGTIDKYMGDCIMAFWNAPLDCKDHADKAVQTSLEICEAADELIQQLEEQGLPRIDIGIGINTGTCIVGNMGSESRFDYSVIGDAVNLGARLEGQTRNYDGVRVLLGPETYRSCTSRAFSEVDRILVKGKSEKVTIYTPLRTV